MNPYTYTPGPTFKLNGPVTAVQVANVIDDLNYLMPGCNFAPEAICEGGISWPVQRQGPYKTFRFDSCMGDWPWLSHPDLNGSLRECDDQVVFDDFRSKSFDTFLKAFHGAPCWTLKELRVFVVAIEKNTSMTLKKMPTAKSLICTRGNLGLPCN